MTLAIGLLRRRAVLTVRRSAGEQNSGPSRPKKEVGEESDVRDRKDLRCADVAAGAAFAPRPARLLRMLGSGDPRGLMSFLQNAWYPSAWSDEVADRPLGRTIAGHPLVIFRTDKGVSALRDRCPHRFMSLSEGRVADGALECPYHGLRFGPDGGCALNPLTGAAMPAVKAGSYPVRELHGIVWVWLGSRQAADDVSPPDFSFLMEPGRAVVKGYAWVGADYQLAVDNLNDLTHVQFVHRDFQASEVYGQLQHKTWRVADDIYQAITFPNGRPARFFHSVMDPERRVDVTFQTKWSAPSLIKLTATVTEPGREDAHLFGNHSAHLIAPENAGSCHYLYAHARDYRLDDPGTDAAVARWQAIGFGEQDKPLLERQQKNLAAAEGLDQPVVLPTDAGAIQARRMLAQMIERENQTNTH